MTNWLVEITVARKEAQNPETPRRILAAAEASFAAHGLAGARTERIASRAGVNKALLYYYFGSKRNLYRAVLRHLLDELRRSIVPPGATPRLARERLEAFVTGYFNFLACHPNYPRLIQREVLESQGEIEWILRDYQRPLLRSFIAILEAGVREGEFRKIDPEQASLSVFGAMVSYFAAAPLWSRFLGRDLLRPAALDARRRALLDFLSHGLLPAPRRAR